MAAKREADDREVPGGKRDKPMVKIWTDGCFDMMHFGHSNALRQAKELGDYLVVGVHSDEEIRRNKGPPVMTEEERYKAAAACRWVDEVVRSAPYTTELDIMDAHGCKYCVHGDDLVLASDGRDSYHKVKAAGRFLTVPRTTGVSTTDLVGRMLLLSRADTPASTPQSATADAATAALVSQMAEGSSGSKRSPYTALSKFVASTKRIVEFTGDRRAPKPSDRVVYIDGSFDLFHVGHIDILKLAREQGDYLMVGLLDDDTVHTLRGRNYPLMNMHERVLSVLACRYVDEVVMAAPYTLTSEFIKSQNIALVVSGTVHEVADHTRTADDPYRVAKEMGIFRQLISPTSITTTDIVRRIIAHRLEFEERNKKKEAKELLALEEEAQQKKLQQQQQQQH